MAVSLSGAIGSELTARVMGLKHYTLPIEVSGVMRMMPRWPWMIPSPSTFPLSLDKK